MGDRVTLDFKAPQVVIGRNFIHNSFDNRIQLFAFTIVRWGNEVHPTFAKKFFRD
jgi:hypothetical protein